MSRLQLALNVSDLDEAVTFYTMFFGVAPAKRYPGYANFAISEPPLKLVLIENPGEGGTLNHLGVEVENAAEVAAIAAALADHGGSLDVEGQVDCCYALQDKVWVEGPDERRWEVYTVLAHTESNDAGRDAPCCTGPAQDDEARTDTACC